LRIALICGSVRENSFTKKLLKKIEENIKADEIELDFIDFSDTPLPIFNGKNVSFANSFIQRVSLADGIIIACPEYHNSFTGVLKNAFDYLSSEQIAEKPIGLIATSGGGKGGINCLNGMRLFLRGMYGFVLPEQIIIDQSEQIDSQSFKAAVYLSTRVMEFSALIKQDGFQSIF